MVGASSLREVRPSTRSRAPAAICDGVRVNTSTPLSVTSTVCSNWAESDPSFVRTVQPSFSVKHHLPPAEVDHGLDREGHPGLSATWSQSGRYGDTPKRPLMKPLPDAVAGVLLHHRTPLRFDVGLYRLRRCRPAGRPGSHGIDTADERFGSSPVQADAPFSATAPIMNVSEESA